MPSCGLLDFVSCLPEAFFSYISSILNAPLQPLLSSIQGLLSAQVNLSLFTSLWAIMIYMLSMFYVLLILYSGFSFIISGYDVQKRESAKEWLKNIIIMIILVQASFFIYELCTQVSASMTTATLSLVGSNIFNLANESIANIGLQIVLYLSSIFVLLATSLLLIIRYGIVAVGVVLFPLGIFLYFLLPLRSYGLLILNFLGISMFVTFLDAIILAGFGRLIDIPLFSNMKFLVIMGAFGLVDILMFFLMFFSIIKSAFNVGMKGASIATKVAAFA